MSFGTSNKWAVMGFFNLYLYLLLANTIVFLVLFAKSGTSATLDSNNQIDVNVGLIYDFDSSTGNMANSCISLALSDFYAKNQHYTTRLALYSKNSSDVLTAALAALELVNKDQVVAIIGPQYANEARFVAEIGGRSQVPIFSLSVKSSSHWPSKTPYFIQTALPDSIQLDGITSLVQQLGWDEIIVIHEDDTEESGNCFIPPLIDTFQKASIQLSYTIAISVTSSVSDHIKKELSHLRSIQTRVFLVHVTTPGLASQLFSLANEVGMMTTGTAWIITDALCNSLSSLDATTIESMEGVLGVRPYVPRLKNMQDFEIRWNEFMPRQKQLKYTEKTRNDFNMFCLRAYEAIWSIAASVENIQLRVNRSHEKLNASGAAITNLRVSEIGPRLVKEILETRLQGFRGEFKVKDEQLETPVLEIINIVGNGETGDRTVGYWTPGRGFSRKIASASEENHEIVYSKQLDGVLKPIIWPGDSTNKPKGWNVPGMGLKLRIGVPEKTGFREFVDVQEIGNTKKYNVTGFSIDVFKAALDTLPYRLEPEFIPFLIVNDSGGPNRTYDDLVNKLRDTKNLDFEAVVGDVTIRANREREVDFSLPYTDSGVVMVVKAKSNRLKHIWMFIAPLSWDLWLTIFLATIFIGLVLRMLERRVNPQRQIGMLFLFPLAALAFPERNMVGNNWARFVLVVWLFMAYVLMQGYTANLSSILTVGQLKPSADIPSCAGYQQGSFVKDFLTNWLNMDITKCHSYLNMEAYDEALSLGCKNGGVDAIYDEIPYIRLFLHKYGSKYKMVGTTYDTGGFGFAFPIGSPLSKLISNAILEVRESGIMHKIEKRYFDAGNTSYYDAEDVLQEDPRFTSKSFAGLFIIAAFFTLLALVCSECSFAMSKYRVHSIEMAHDVSPQNDLQLQDHQKEDDEILAEEERKEQDLLQEITDINIDHERMTMDDQVNVYTIV